MDAGFETAWKKPSGVGQLEQRKENPMRKQLVAVLAIILVAGLLGAVAQQTKAVVDIPFSFVAAGKTLPPGNYNFNPGKVPNEIVIRNNKTSESLMVPVVTRLSPKPDAEPVIVFDKVENDHYFAELYLPGLDGYAVQGYKGEHTHVQLRPKK
jgi:hypothetical protein